MTRSLIALLFIVGCTANQADSEETGVDTHTGIDDTGPGPDDTGDDTGTQPLETAQLIVEATRLGEIEDCELNGSNGITVGTGEEFELTEGAPISFTIGHMEDENDDVPTHDAGDLWLWTSRPFTAVFDAATDTVIVTLDNLEDSPIVVERDADDGMFHITRPLTFFYDAMSYCPSTAYFYDENAPGNVGRYMSGPTGGDTEYDLAASKGYYFINDDQTPNVPWFFADHRIEFESDSITLVDIDEEDDERYELTGWQEGVDENNKLFFEITFVAYSGWEPLDTTVARCTEK